MDNHSLECMIHKLEIEIQNLRSEISEIKENEFLWLNQILRIQDVTSGSVHDNVFSICGKHGNKEFVDFPLEVLYKFTQLSDLKIFGNDLYDINFIKQCKNLSKLNIEFCDKLVDISVLNSLNLQQLRIFKSPLVKTSTLKVIHKKVTIYVEKIDIDLINNLNEDNIIYNIIESEEKIDE